MSEPQNTPDIDTQQNAPTAPPAGEQMDTRAQNSVPLQQPMPPTERGPQTASPTSNQDQSVPSSSQRPPQQWQPKGVFEHILKGLDPTPDFIKDENGNQIPVPKTKGSITKHILAAALTSIVEGANAGTTAAANAPYGPAGTMGPKNMAAMGAGGQAAEQVMQRMKAEPQQQYDEAKLRQYNTMKRNIDLHTQMINLGHASHEAQMEAYTPEMGLAKQIMATDTEEDPSKKFFLDTTGLTGEQLKQKYAGKFGRNDFMVIGTKPMVNPDGSPAYYPGTETQQVEPMFAVVNPNATLPATEEVKAQLAYLNPQAKTIPANAAVRAGLFLNSLSVARNQTLVKAAGQSWGEQLAAATGDKSLAGIDLSKSKDPLIRQNLGAIADYNHEEIDKALDEMRKQEVGGKLPKGLSAAVAHELGMDRTKDGKSYSEILGMKRADDLAKQKSDEEVDRRRQDDVERRRLHKEEIADAADIKTKGVEGASNASQAFPNNWKDPKTGTNWDMSHPAMKLVEGTLSPSELSKRATKGSDSYNAIIKQADDYSMAKFGKPFDFQKADGDYKYANQRMTRDTLNLIQSLTGEGAENNSGTLLQLQRQYTSLGNTPFRTVNDAKQWISQHIGEPGVPQFQATLFGVSDEMAKILGGGTATVEGFKQAQAILDKLFSDKASLAAINAVRGNMANRANGMIGDNVYLTKQYGKVRNPLEPNDVPKINGVVPVKQRVVNGQTYFMLPTGVVVDRKGQTVDLK